MKISGINDTNDSTDQFDQNDITQNKAMAVLSYFFILVLIPIFAAKDSKFARYHANQGLTLFILEVIYSIFISVLSAIIVAISAKLMFICYIFSLFSLVILALIIIGIVNSASGRAKALPIIGGLHLIA